MVWLRNKKTGGLFNTDDIGKNKKVLGYSMEDTGIGYRVGMGKLSNGYYFGISDDSLNIYDTDYHKAYLEGKTVDYDWEEKHLVKSYNNNTEEYDEIGNQTKEFKVDEEELVKRINNISNNSYMSRRYAMGYNVNPTGIELPLKEIDGGYGIYYRIEEYLEELRYMDKISKREKDYLIRKSKKLYDKYK